MSLSDKFALVNILVCRMDGVIGSLVITSCRRSAME